MELPEPKKCKKKRFDTQEDKKQINIFDTWWETVLRCVQPFFFYNLKFCEKLGCNWFFLNDLIFIKVYILFCHET
jgi:hypothetical protein